MWRGRGLLVLAAFSSLGCSFLFTTSVPENAEELPPEEPITCTTSNAAPVVDTVIAGYQVFRTIYALSADESDYRGLPISQGVDIALGLTLLTLFGTSAIHGFGVTSECSDAKEQHHTRYREEIQDRHFEREQRLRREREAEENDDDDERPSRKRKRKRKEAIEPEAPAEVDAGAAPVSPVIEAPAGDAGAPAPGATEAPAGSEAPKPPPPTQGFAPVPP